MVERGLGMAFLPHIAVAHELRRKILVAMDVVDGEPLRRSLDVLHSRQRPLTSTALAFLHLMKSAAEKAAYLPNSQAHGAAGQK
jgi:DNA-binding transcriptional LysR family regulator